MDFSDSTNRQNVENLHSMALHQLILRRLTPSTQPIQTNVFMNLDHSKLYRQDWSKNCALQR